MPRTSNPGMLSVAARTAPDIEWRQGAAESLPYPDETFDSVVNQFGLMFFTHRRAALQEMVRVLVPGGRLAVAVFDSLVTAEGTVEFPISGHIATATKA